MANTCQTPGFGLSENQHRQEGVGDDELAGEAHRIDFPEFSTIDSLAPQDVHRRRAVSSCGLGQLRCRV